MTSRRTRITISAATALAATLALAAPAGAAEGPHGGQTRDVGLAGCEPEITWIGPGDQPDTAAVTFWLPTSGNHGQDCGPTRLEYYTFRVPHPMSSGRWLDGQVLADFPILNQLAWPSDKPTTWTLRLHTLGSPDAPPPACWQTDFVIADQATNPDHQAYAAFTSDNGICDDTAATSTTTAAPTPPATDVPTTVVPPATDGGTVTDGPRGNDVPPSNLGPVGDDQSVGVEASSVRAGELPMTGARRTGLLAAIAAALLGGGATLVGLSRRAGRKETGQ